MRIKLTNKLESYANKGLRDRFLAGNKWLGTVTDDGGLRGALMQSTTGAYFLVRSFNKTVKLDPDAVALALAVLMQPPAPKRPPGRPRKALMPPAPGVAPKRPPGRPNQYGEPMRSCLVSLPPAAMDAARELGQGVLSAGVRAMVADYMERLQHAKD